MLSRFLLENKVANLDWFVMKKLENMARNVTIYYIYNSHIYLWFSYHKKWSIVSQMIYLIFMRMFTLTITIERFLISFLGNTFPGGVIIDAYLSRSFVHSNTFLHFNKFLWHAICHSSFGRGKYAKLSITMQYE